MLVVACGSSGDDFGQGGPRLTKEGSRQFDVYMEAFSACTDHRLSLGPSGTTSRLVVPEREASAYASGYAETYPRQKYREDAYRGCLAGLNPYVHEDG